MHWCFAGPCAKFDCKCFLPAPIQFRTMLQNTPMRSIYVLRYWRFMAFDLGGKNDTGIASVYLSCFYSFLLMTFPGSPRLFDIFISSLEHCHWFWNLMWGYIWNALSLSHVVWKRRLWTINSTGSLPSRPKKMTVNTYGPQIGTTVDNLRTHIKQKDHPQTRRCRYWERWYKNQITTNIDNNSFKKKTQKL